MASYSPHRIASLCTESRTVCVVLSTARGHQSRGVGCQPGDVPQLDRVCQTWVGSALVGNDASVAHLDALATCRFLPRCDSLLRATRCIWRRWLMEPPARGKCHRGRREDTSNVEDSVNVPPDPGTSRFTTANIIPSSCLRPPVAHGRVPTSRTATTGRWHSRRHGWRGVRMWLCGPGPHL